MALKLRRAEERLIPKSTRAASFKRLLGGGQFQDIVGSVITTVLDLETQRLIPNADTYARTFIPAPTALEYGCRGRSEEYEFWRGGIGNP